MTLNAGKYVIAFHARDVGTIAMVYAFIKLNGKTIATSGAYDRLMVTFTEPGDVGTRSTISMKWAGFLSVRAAPVIRYGT